MEEQKILESPYDYTKEIAKLVEIDQQDFQGVQQVIVNNQIQEIPYTVKQWVLKCPRCGKTLQAFNDQGIERVEIIKFLAINGEKYNKNSPYCIGCGQKLNFKYEIIEGSNLVKEGEEA